MTQLSGTQFDKTTTARNIGKYFDRELLYVLGSPQPSTEPKCRNPEKSQKSLPRVVRDPRLRTPKKFPKKSEKSGKKLNLTIFLTFQAFWGTFWGSGVGVPNSSRETFLRLFGFFESFRGFGVWAL